MFTDLIKVSYIVLLTFVTLLKIVFFGLELDNASMELLDFLLKVVRKKSGDVNSSADSSKESFLGFLDLFLALFCFLSLTETY